MFAHEAAENCQMSRQQRTKTYQWSIFMVAAVKQRVLPFCPWINRLQSGLGE